MWNLAIFRHFAVGRRELQSNVPFECALTGPNQTGHLTEALYYLHEFIEITKKRRIRCGGIKQ